MEISVTQKKGEKNTQIRWNTSYKIKYTWRITSSMKSYLLKEHEAAASKVETKITEVRRNGGDEAVGDGAT